MEIGDHGVNTVLAPDHVEEVFSNLAANAIILLLEMAANIALDLVFSLEAAILTVVQMLMDEIELIFEVNNVLLIMDNVFLFLACALLQHGFRNILMFLKKTDAS